MLKKKKGSKRKKEYSTKWNDVDSALHHEVTKLPNRILFESSLQSQISSNGDSAGYITVVLVHMTRFNEVNKAFGHMHADSLLCRIGENIDSHLQRSRYALAVEKTETRDYYAAHVEGVSFCFALGTECSDGLEDCIETLVLSMSEAIDFMGLVFRPNFAIGCSSTKANAHSAQALLRHAFIAFDRANGRTFKAFFYTPENNPYASQKLHLMMALRSAIEENSLVLHFQPQLRLKSGSVCGFEALLRWIHQDLGFIPPDEFIVMAEQAGLMSQLTSWVIKQALMFSNQLQDLACCARISVNISALNLHDSQFCRQVEEQLQQAGVGSECLILEVTETAAMTDPDCAIKVLKKLNDMGVRLSVDDFGTGHSSLSYIQKLPVHEIKIDRAFVGGMHTNQNDKAIVRTSIDMCHALGYEVVAEGVENEEIMDILKTMGCDIAQGYHIAKPMSVDDIILWIKNSQWVSR